MPTRPQPEEQAYKRVPESPEARRAIREAAARWGFEGTPTREALRGAAAQLLAGAGLPQDYLGFAMVALSNAWWAAPFAAVPFERRLLLLPQCLRSSSSCSAVFEAGALVCARCGLCPIEGVLARAERLGYRVSVAEGVTSVSTHALEGGADAILGVACLDSLEKSYGRIAEWGIPHLAVPLLADGCRDTETDLDELMRLIEMRSEAPPVAYSTYLPLLRFANRLFDGDWIEGDSEADRLARQWLKAGGKRFRPFAVLAAYAAAKHGTAALDSQADLGPLVPEAVRRLAVAVEAMHKASLAHDDVEDDDPMRYGRETLHRAHGVPIAVNVGDYLVGFGYRLAASCAEELGPEAASDVLGRLAAAHVELCRGQGWELQWTRERPEALSPLEALKAYRQKTAPAFAAALYVGLRAAGPVRCAEALERFGSYVGEAYQVLNDLDDWEDADGKGSVGLDARAMRPTVLLAFALEAGAGPAIRRAMCDPRSGASIAELAAIYRESGAIRKAETLYAKLRARALGAAEACADPAVRALLGFLARTILPERAPA